MSMGNSNYEEKGDVQMQTQTNKQIVTLKQDQNSSNFIMCKILSALENIAKILGYKERKIFDYYSTLSKDKNSVIEQILLQMKIFESSYKSYVKKHPNKQYEYPENLTLSDIKDIVDKWKNAIKKNKSNESYISYYDDFINILSNNSLSKTFNDEFENIDKNAKKISNVELKRVMNAASHSTCYTNEVNNNIEKEINEKGDYKVKVVLNGDRKDNKLNKNMEKYEEKFKNLKSDLNKYLDLILGNLELYAALKANTNNKINIKYANKLNNKDLEKKIISEFSKALKKYNDIYNKLFEEFGFTLPKEEKNTIKKDLNNWKNNLNKEEQLQEFDEAITCICEEGESLI
jgi:hypothetical protein